MTCPYKKYVSSFLVGLFTYWKATIRSPQSLLFSRLNSPNPPSLSSNTPCQAMWHSTELKAAFRSQNKVTWKQGNIAAAYIYVEQITAAVLSGTLADTTTRPSSTILGRSWWLVKDPDDWKKANITPIFWKGKMGSSTIQKSAKSEFSPWKVYGANPTGSHLQMLKEQEGDGKLPACIYPGQTMPDTSHSFLYWDDWLCAWGQSSLFWLYKGFQQGLPQCP